MNLIQHTLGMRTSALPITFTRGCLDFGIGAAAVMGAATLGGGILSSFTAGQANRRAQLMAREQMAFNRDEAEKNRKWQENYYSKFSSPSALAAQYRAAGLNPQLTGIQQGSVPQGSAASYSDVPAMQNEGAPLAAAVSSAADQMLTAYQNQTNRNAQQSQSDLNSSLEALNEAQKQLSEAQKSLTEQSTEVEKQRVEQMKQDVAFLIKTFDARVNQEYSNTIIKNWMETDVQFGAMQKMWDYYNVSPLRQQQMLSQSLNFYANAYKAIAQGDLTRKDFEYYEKRFSLMQFQANTDRIQANAFSRDVDNKAPMYKASAREMNASSAYQEMYNSMMGENVGTFQWNPKTKRYDIPYQDKRLRVGLDLTLSQNRRVAENLALQPDLLRSMQFNNYVAPFGQAIGSVAEGVTKGIVGAKGKGKGTQRVTERYDSDGAYRGSTVTTTDPRYTIRY